MATETKHCHEIAEVPAIIAAAKATRVNCEPLTIHIYIRDPANGNDVARVSVKLGIDRDKYR